MCEAIEPTSCGFSCHAIVVFHVMPSKLYWTYDHLNHARERSGISCRDCSMVMSDQMQRLVMSDQSVFVAFTIPRSIMGGHVYEKTRVLAPGPKDLNITIPISKCMRFQTCFGFGLGGSILSFQMDDSREAAKALTTESRRSMVISATCFVPKSGCRTFMCGRNTLAASCPTATPEAVRRPPPSRIFKHGGGAPRIFKYAMGGGAPRIFKYGEGGPPRIFKYGPLEFLNMGGDPPNF